jgi:hypothetical protein
MKSKLITAFTMLTLVFAPMINTCPAFCTVETGQIAPGFTLYGLDSRPYTLRSVASNGATALFFFCGCSWCHDTSRQWSLALRRGAVPAHVRTVIVYAGGKDEAEQFVKATGIDQSRSTILLDDELNISAGVYQAEPCPRVFVLSPNLTVVYTNDHPTDAPRTISGSALVAEVIVALQPSGAQANAVSNAQPQMLSIPPVYLSPVIGNGVTIEQAGLLSEAVYNFGVVDQSKTKTIEHVFQFRNDTRSTILIDRLVPSCGCTTAFIENTDSFPVSVKAGDTVRVNAYVDLTNLFPAAIEKSIMLFQANQDQPLAYLEIDGTVDPAH